MWSMITSSVGFSINGKGGGVTVNVFGLVMELLKVTSEILFLMLRHFVAWLIFVAAVLVLIRVIEAFVGSTAALIIAEFCLVMVGLKFVIMSSDKGEEGDE